MFDRAAAGAARRRVWLHCVGSSSPSSRRSAERALPLARGDDLVCVPQPVDPEYLGYLASLGLGPGAANVLVAPASDDATRPLAGRVLDRDGTADWIARRLGPAGCELLPYAGTAEVFALARALEDAAGGPVRVHAAPPEVTAVAARRDLARGRALELGIPVAEGEVVALPPHGRRRRDLEPLRTAIERRLRGTGRVMVRAALAERDGTRWFVGSGGDDADDVLRRVAEGAVERTYVVEVLAEATVCSTVHLRVEPGTGRIRTLGVSDRRVGRGLAAAGSRLPTAARTSERMERWAVLLAGWLRGLGYVGQLGVDFAEYRDGDGRPDALFTGLVPRAGEATYTMAIAAALSAPACVSGTVATRANTFGRVRETLGGLLYHPDRGAGVLPYATGSLEHGRCPVVALGSDRLQAAELLGKARAALEGEPAGPWRG